MDIKQLTNAFDVTQRVAEVLTNELRNRIHEKLQLHERPADDYHRGHKDAVNAVLSFLRNFTVDEMDALEVYEAFAGVEPGEGAESA